MHWGYYSSMIILLPAMALAMYAQFKVKSTFAKFSKVNNKKGVTGAEVARQLLATNRVTDVTIEHVRGNLTDHYDPRNKVLRLSDSVYDSTSLAAVGVAAHETGHAMQHNQGYVPLNLRSSIFPLVNIGSNASMPLILLGLFMSSGSGSIGDTLMVIGIVLFCAVVAFQLVTLPVEFNASSRALKMLGENRLLSDTEIGSAKKVLSAAALTYVAAVAVSIANLLRFVMMLTSSRNRR